MKQIFAQITKVTELPDGTCRVDGTAAAEVVDKTREIMDYATARPQIEKWRDECLTRSDGRSHGNIRAMHGKVAAGKATGIEFDDVNKVVNISTHIIDPVEAQKCREGIYCGFSVGGDYLKRWPDPNQKGVTRYTPSLSEISLVDNPCIPNAVFSHVKMDGAAELCKFVGAEGGLSARRGRLQKPGTAESAEVKKGGPGGASTASKTATETATKTSTEADTKHNVTVTGGAGDGDTVVTISVPGEPTKAKKKPAAEDDASDESAKAEKQYAPDQARNASAKWALDKDDEGSPHIANQLRGKATAARADGKEPEAASLHAEAATHDAMSENTPEAHDAAAKKHDAAAEAHGDANPLFHLMHQARAAYHQNTADKLRSDGEAEKLAKDFPNPNDSTSGGTPVKCPTCGAMGYDAANKKCEMCMKAEKLAKRVCPECEDADLDEDGCCPKCGYCEDDDEEMERVEGGDPDLQKFEVITTFIKQNLVTEDDGTKHLPVGDPAHMGAAWAALHSNYRGQSYQGPDKEKAKAKLKALYARKGMKTPSEKWDGEGGLEKGGPGSGPHPGSGKKTPEELSNHANALSDKANKVGTARAHQEAANAHFEAAKAHSDGKPSKYGSTTDMHDRLGRKHEWNAQDIRSSEPGSWGMLGSGNYDGRHDKAVKIAPTRFTRIFGKKYTSGSLLKDFTTLYQRTGEPVQQTEKGGGQMATSNLTNELAERLKKATPESLGIFAGTLIKRAEHMAKIKEGLDKAVKAHEDLCDNLDKMKDSMDDMDEDDKVKEEDAKEKEGAAKKGAAVGGLSKVLREEVKTALLDSYKGVLKAAEGIAASHELIHGAIEEYADEANTRVEEGIAAAESHPALPSIPSYSSQKSFRSFERTLEKMNRENQKALAKMQRESDRKLESVISGFTGGFTAAMDKSAPKLSATQPVPMRFAVEKSADGTGMVVKVANGTGETIDNPVSVSPVLGDGITPNPEYVKMAAASGDACEKVLRKAAPQMGNPFQGIEELMKR